jgi:hypothetical protein
VAERQAVTAGPVPRRHARVERQARDHWQKEGPWPKDRPAQRRQARAKEAPKLPKCHAVTVSVCRRCAARAPPQRELRVVTRGFLCNITHRTNLKGTEVPLSCQWRLQVASVAERADGMGLAGPTSTGSARGCPTRNQQSRVHLRVGHGYRLLEGAAMRNPSPSPMSAFSTWHHRRCQCATPLA